MKFASVKYILLLFVVFILGGCNNLGGSDSEQRLLHGDNLKNVSLNADSLSSVALIDQACGAEGAKDLILQEFGGNGYEPTINILDSKSLFAKSKIS